MGSGQYDNIFNYLTISPRLKYPDGKIRIRLNPDKSTDESQSIRSLTGQTLDRKQAKGHEGDSK
jgi:hypothetical protein